MSIIKIIGVVLVILGILFMLEGWYTITKPTYNALNQTASSLPSYFASVLGSEFSGVPLIILGLGFFSIGAFILSRS